VLQLSNFPLVVDNVFSHETTSSAFTWMTYLLARHPDIQTRLRAEIYNAIPRDRRDRPDTEIAAILESLPLLNGVCHETLRMYPTVPIVKRVSKHHNTILGQEIRPGTLVVMVPWAVNNDPSIWGPEASSFIPERWIDSTTGKPNYTGGVDTNYAVMTFLHGPRSCIGQNFAKAELRCLAAAFTGAFEFEMMGKSEEVVPAGIITAKPRDGLKLKLKSVRPWVCSG
jgi:cytochrome P450